MKRAHLTTRPIYHVYSTPTFGTLVRGYLPHNLSMWEKRMQSGDQFGKVHPGFYKQNKSNDLVGKCKGNTAYSWWMGHLSSVR